VAGVVRLAVPPSGPWRPWVELRRAANPSTGGGPRAIPTDLQRALTVLADRQAASGRSEGPVYLYPRLAEGRGAVAALQVAAQDWMLILFPQTRSTFALAPALLLALLLGAVIAGFEANRRRAERAQKNAEREMREKQSLLDTMQVPLMVV